MVTGFGKSCAGNVFIRNLPILTVYARNPSINPCFWMERSVGTLNWFTTMLGWQVNQTGRVAIKNIEVERKKSKRRQGSHFARRLVSRGLGFLDRWCS